MRLFAQITCKHGGLIAHRGWKKECKSMNLQEVKDFLESNKDSQDVQSYLNGLKTVSVDDVKGFLDTEEGKRFIQPNLDSYFAKGLETWKQNNLEKLINEEVSKRNPELTEEQKRITALEQELDKRDKEAKRERLRNHALGKAQEMKLPTNLIDRFLGEDETQTDELLNTFAETLQATINQEVENKFKESGRTINEPNTVTNSNRTKSIAEMAEEARIIK